MQHTKTLTGAALLVADGKTLGGVGYRLDCFASEFQQQVTGRLTGDSAILMRAAMSNGKLQLRLEDGGVVDIVPTKTTGDGMAFAVSGPVPGC